MDFRVACPSVTFNCVECVTDDRFGRAFAGLWARSAGRVSGRAQDGDLPFLPEAVSPAVRFLPITQ